MQWSDIQFNPPTRTLRQFAALWTLFFGGLAAGQYIARGNVWAAGALAVLAITIGPLGLVQPRLMRPIFVGWMIVAFPIGWTVSRLVLGLLFYGLFTPLAIYFRWTGRDPLCRRRRLEKESYWTTKPAPTNVRQYFNQS